MSTRQKIVTHISIAAVLSIGLFAFSIHRASIANYVGLSSRSIELELIQINNHDQSPSVNSISESDTLTRK
jgi:hypothetical protein